MAALARVVERIECLFLVAENKQFSPEEVKAHEARLRRRWSADISLTIAPAVRPDAPLTRWQHYGRGIFDFHSQPIARVLNNQGAVTAVARALQTRPNLILVHRLSAMCAVMRTVRSIDPTPLFFDLDDIEHVAFFRRLIRHPDWPTERLMLLQTPRLLLAEIQAILLTRATFVCSEPDRRYLSRFTGSRRLQVVPNSIPFPASVSAEPSEPLVLFVGTMSYEPNALAADMLVKEVWPTVRARVPEARLVIAGTRPELATSYPPKDPSISFAGFVDNLGELYSRARVVCC
ncbi:MAG: glycosyltransferase, partial [Acidimicrobiales bacterium]